MSRQRFETALDDLHDGLLSMGALVVDQLRAAAVALEDGDTSLARSVIERDAAVNDRYMDIERRCIDLLALQSPVATDLRRVAASFKISTDLERLGDLAVNVAGYAAETDHELFDVVPLGDIAETAIDLVSDALVAFAEDGDGWRCHEVADRDTELDAMCAHAGDVIVRALVDDGTENEAVESLVADVSRLLLTVRDLERVGDHAVNIAARTLYMTEGDETLLE